MTSPTQIASNRQNSTLSTGPRTEAGKIASSKNAISHGLSAADPVLAYENRADYEKLVDDYTNEYEPDTIHQTFLVSQLAGARWRLNRIQRIENAGLDLIIAGTVKEADQFRAYSPYHHVTKGTQYPAILFLTGANDPRVDPSHSRKMTAILEASGTNRPVLLRTTNSAGHGIGTALSETIAQEADVTAFLFDQLGVHENPIPAR
jgi:hypothetical protein